MPAFLLQFQIIAQNNINLLHPGIGVGVDLRAASCHDNFSCGVFAPRFTDGLARLALSLLGHRAGIHNDRIVDPRLLRVILHHRGLIGIQPAAKG